VTPLADLEKRARKLDAEERSDVSALLYAVVHHLVEHSPSPAPRAVAGVPVVTVTEDATGTRSLRIDGVHIAWIAREEALLVRDAFRAWLAAHWPTAPRESGPDVATLQTALDQACHERDARDAEIERLRERLASALGAGRVGESPSDLRRRLKRMQEQWDKRVAEAVARETLRCALACIHVAREWREESTLGFGGEETRNKLRIQSAESAELCATRLTGKGIEELRRLYKQDCDDRLARAHSPASPAGEAHPPDPWCTATIPVSAGGVAGTMRCSLSNCHEGQHECRGPGGNMLLAWPQQEPAGEAPLIVEHIYTSTACAHGRCDECRKTCKFCPATCRCECHGSGRAAKTFGAQHLDEREGAPVARERGGTTQVVSAAAPASAPKEPASSPPPVAPDVDEVENPNDAVHLLATALANCMADWQYDPEDDRSVHDWCTHAVKRHIRPLLIAARAEAYERAAKECDREEMSWRPSFPREAIAADQCARRIRALVKP